MKIAQDKTQCKLTELISVCSFHQSMNWKTEYIISIVGFLDTVNLYNAIKPETINSLLESKQLFSIFIVT